MLKSSQHILAVLLKHILLFRDWPDHFYRKCLTVTLIFAFIEEKDGQVEMNNAVD